MADSFAQNDVDMRAIYMLGSTGFKPCGVLPSNTSSSQQDTSSPFALIDIDLFKLILEALCSNCFIVVCILLVFCYSSAMNSILSSLHSALLYLT